jgi:hypothetical protein
MHKPAAAPRHWTIDDIRHANAAAGLYFFEPGALRFFRSLILPTVHQGPGGVFFITSERNDNASCYRPRRRYTVRRFNPAAASVRTEGAFQYFATAAAAHATAARLARGEG